MTVSNLTVKQRFNGNGSTVDFAIPFDFDNNAEILVYIRDENVDPITETLKTITTHYTLTGDSNGQPSTVTFGTAPVSTDKVLLIRGAARTQTRDFAAGSIFPAESNEQALDHLLRITQENEEVITRAITIRKTTTGITPDLPELVADTMLLVNPAADGFIMGPTAAAIPLAEEWATKTSAIVDATDYSSKEFAIGSQAATGGSSKNWAQQTAADVTGAGSGDMSSKEWAVGIDGRGVAGEGSSKDWATYTAGTVDGTGDSAKTHATNAAASASAASTSETNAATSETNAAASAALAIYRDTIYITNSDSPVTVAITDVGKLYSIDASGGAVIFNLPQISTYVTTGPMVFLRTEGGANAVTINRASTDTIGPDSDTAVVLTGKGKRFKLIPDTGASPDNWGQEIGGQNPIGYLKDIQTNSTAGGTFTSGADRTRVLNTSGGDFASFGTLSSNAFTLIAGIYDVEGGGPGNFVNSFVHWLYQSSATNGIMLDVDGDQVVAIVSNTKTGITNDNKFQARISISASTAFELRARCGATRSGDGFGSAASGTGNTNVDSVFGWMRIEKIK